MRRTRNLIALAMALSLLPAAARADSVAQIATAIRIDRGTATLIDPQGRPGEVAMGSDTAVRVGDVLTFRLHFTPVPNGAVRGLGGYVTIYVPRNTEVVGARIVDAMGRTIPPHRGGWAADGTGPRGLVSINGRDGGSMAQLYADTGIFYSVDARTGRRPLGTVASERYLSLFNGILLTPRPTGIGGLARILGSNRDMPYAHNYWDVIQVYAFGIRGAPFSNDGRGNTVDRYGSPVAGPDSFYRFEASYSGAYTGSLDPANVSLRGRPGPWRRIQTMGAEMGRRGVTPPVPDPGMSVRLGVPAVDAMGRPLGVAVDADNPLPSYDPASPTTPYTRALRYAVGELVVGEEYRCEFSLRVLRTPLDPVSGSDTICGEVFGGDASSESPDGADKGKDHAWRYFLPAPACVNLNLLFDLDVDKLVALPGDRLTYTIHVKNLSTRAHTNVRVQHCYETAAVSFVSATGGGVDGPGSRCPDPALQDAVEWTIPRLEPGEERTYTVVMNVLGGARGDSTVGRAIFTSTELPAPGFQTVAFTTIQELTVIQLDMTATPNAIASPPGTVTYVATIRNDGTGLARGNGGYIRIELPSGFGYVAGSSRLDGAAFGDPAVTGSRLEYTAGLPDIPAGGMVRLSFRARVPASTPMGLYTAGIETYFDDVGGGMWVNDARSGLAPVAVGAVRSDPPVVSAPVVAGATRVGGTTTEAAGTTIRVFLDGIQRAETTSDAAGNWSVTIPTAYPGLRIYATAQAPGELESLPSDEVRVEPPPEATVACNDGVDNDGDGLTDFPEDPDCASALDLDEAHTPACADGVDNDGDGLTDFGSDPGCSSLLDDDESGAAECADGVDNDGDGLTDHPDDPGCDSAMDVSERDIPACADGVDNDGDGLTDFPFDDGCSSAADTDETSPAPTMPDAGVPDAGTTTDAGMATDAGMGTDAGVATDAGRADGSGVGVDAEIPDWGGVDPPNQDGGCGCAVGAEPADRGAAALGWLLLGLLLAVRSRRRR